METPNLDPTPSPSPSLGLPIASLVLGILATVLSFLVLGSVLGLVGLALGMTHLLKKRRPAGMARWGTVLSILGIVASVGFGAFYYYSYQKFTKSMEASSQTGDLDLTKWEGVLAPDITITTLDGQAIKLSTLKGKRVVLDFWATWCPP